jgi:uncharacterized membrane protein YbhN (UPF0104 family)
MKKYLGFALKVGVSIAILGLIATRTDVSRIGTLLASVESGTVLAALLLALAQTALVAYRWVLVMESVGVAVGLWPVLQAVLVSLLLNQCLPSFVGADAYRMYWLYRESDRLGPAVRSVLIDRMLGMIALIAMFTAGIAFLFQRIGDPAAKSGLLVLLLCSLGGSIAFFTGDLLPKSWQRLRALRELANVSAPARALMLTARSGIIIGVMSILVHVLTAVVMFMFARNLGLPLTLLDCLLFMPPIMLLASVPISIAGWGVREGVMAGALSMIGVGTEQALALSVLMGFTMLASGVIGVLPLVFGGQRYWAGRASYLLPASEEVRSEE